jgi:Xaa-Pro aminopeptidase
MLLTSAPNIRYLTGFSGTSALVFVPVHGEMLFISDFRYETQAAEEIGACARVVIDQDSVWGRLWRELPTLSTVEIAGFESAHLVHRDFERLLDGGKRWQWRPTVDLVERLREQKDPQELADITAAAAVATRALGRLLPELRAGLNELEVAGMLERTLREEGSEAYPFPSIIASGERSALPHARTSSRQVASGDFLLMDFGAAVRGYCADVTRTVIVGHATTEQREVYGVVQTANAMAASQVRVGMTGKAADALARDYIDARGYGAAFGHSLGHGIGLEVHEAPRLSRLADAPLAERAVVTIEPGIYRPGWGGVRIEDDVYLGPNGPTVLTHFARDLVEVG